MAQGTDHQRILLPLLARLGRRRTDALPGHRSPRYLRRGAAERSVSPAYSPPTAPGVTTISRSGNYGDTGLFGLARVTLFNKLNMLQGVRYDYYTPNFTGQDNGEGLTRAKDSGGATTYNTSVSYRLPFHISPYFTDVHGALPRSGPRRRNRLFGNSDPDLDSAFQPVRRRREDQRAGQQNLRLARVLPPEAFLLSTPTERGDRLFPHQRRGRRNARRRSARSSA